MHKFLCQLYRNGDYLALRAFYFKTVAWIQVRVGQRPALYSAKTDGDMFHQRKLEVNVGPYKQRAFSKKKKKIQIQFKPGTARSLTKILI